MKDLNNYVHLRVKDKPKVVSGGIYMVQDVSYRYDHQDWDIILEKIGEPTKQRNSLKTDVEYV